MKHNISISSTSTATLVQWFQQLEQRHWVMRSAEWLSACLEEDISPRTFLHLLHVQLSLMVAFLPIEGPVWWHVLAVSWAVQASQMAYRSWKRQEEAASQPEAEN